MIFNSDIFCAEYGFVRLRDINTALIIFKYLTKTSGFEIFISKIKDTPFINAIKGVTSYIAYINTICFVSIVLKDIYVCNLLHHNTGNSAYVNIYTICDMKLYASSFSA